MSWSLQLGKIKGIQIKVHASFALILIWGALNYGGSRGWRGAVYGVGIVLLIFAIVLLHELGHSLAAMAFGIKVQDITLLPIGGLARLERMPSKPWQEFIVAAAGPFVNFVMALALFPFVLWTIWAREGDIFHVLMMIVAAPSGWVLIQFLFTINVSLLVFNLIPAFPMDGGRIFRALLAMLFGTTAATRVAVWLGQVLAFLLGAYAIWQGNWMLVFIAIFIFVAGGSEKRAVLAKQILDKISVRQIVPDWGITLSPILTVGEVTGTILRNAQSSYPVVLGENLLGVIRRNDIRQTMNTGKQWATMAEIMRRDFPSIDIDATLTDLENLLSQKKQIAAAVYEDNRFKGLVDYEDIERAYRLYRRIKN